MIKLIGLNDHFSSEQSLPLQQSLASWYDQLCIHTNNYSITGLHSETVFGDLGDVVLDPLVIFYFLRGLVHGVGMKKKALLAEKLQAEYLLTWYGNEYSKVLGGRGKKSVCSDNEGKPVNWKECPRSSFDLLSALELGGVDVGCTPEPRTCCCPAV